MEFKDLGLNREKIKGVIESYPEAIVTEEIKPDDLTIYHVKIPDVEKATINVYFKRDGNTTLYAKTGKNQELSEKIAQHIVDHCEFKDVPAKTLYVKKMADHEFESLQEFLEGYNVTITDGSNVKHGKQYKATGPYGDYIYINRYNSGSFQVQGSSKVVKAWVIEGLTELLPYKEVINIQLASLDVAVDSDQVIATLQQTIPSVYDFLGETLIAITSPSVALASLKIELRDYSSFIFPALKGLEGYIKKLFKEQGIIIPLEGFGSELKTEANGDITFNKAATIALISNSTIRDAITKSYAYYKRQRHTTFHVDGTIESTRIIETKQEADDILAEIFDVMETTYRNIAR